MLSLAILALIIIAHLGRGGGYLAIVTILTVFHLMLTLHLGL